MIRLKSTYGSFVNKYYAPGEDRAEFRIGADKLEPGKEYTLKVRAVSAYRHRSDIEVKITAQ